MSLITRCPACGTMFKVVPDQLKISEGWVRCGHCAEVFDAAAHLQDGLPPQPADQTPARPPVPSVSLPVGGPLHMDHPAPQDGLDEAVDSLVFAEPLPVAESAPPAPYFIEAAPELRLPDGPGPSLPPEMPGDALDAAFAAPLSEDARTDALADSMADPLAEAAAGPVEPSFVRQAQKQTWWRKPAVRAVLGLLLLVLLAALALQVVVQERDRIAAAAPAAKPWLQQLCGALGCEVQPLRQIDAIVIDSSSFNKIKGDSFKLGFVVRNASAGVLATPAVELTLTDTQDQPVVRRVFLPREIAGAPPALGAGSEWPATLTLALDPGTARIAGYRLIAFYP